MSGVKFNPIRGAIADFNLSPAQGSEMGKIRPCIVVTNDVCNSRLTVIQVVPITQWSEKKSRIVTNITLEPSQQNGLSKKSIADCLQTRPIDYTKRFVRDKRIIEADCLRAIDNALLITFRSFNIV